MMEKQTSMALERKMKQESIARADADAKVLEMESVILALEDKLANLQRDADVRCACAVVLLGLNHCVHSD
jgi:hypothetical protein